MSQSEQECPPVPVHLTSMRSVVAYHLQKGAAISLWRLPHTVKKNLIVSTKEVNISADTPIEQLKPGFILAPFKGKADFFFMEANTSYVFDASTTAKETGWPTSTPIPFHTLPIPHVTCLGKEHYLKLVKKAIQYIARGDFQKIVPSRREIIPMPPTKAFDPLTVFNQLCSQYPHALVSLVSAHKVGTWIGASPELLASLDNNMQFKTSALAGTQATPFDNDLKSVLWGQKEMEEQALVSQYIVNCFEQLKIKAFEKSRPKTWQAGNLIHLKTNFNVDTRAIQHPQLPSKMLTLLHPTSAVCGMPKEAALAFLKANEPFDRQFYSGYIGPVNYEGESHLYVNLRCMQWNDDYAALYAGAGITRASIPEKEWAETEMKMNTLLHIIKN